MSWVVVKIKTEPSWSKTTDPQHALLSFDQTVHVAKPTHRFKQIRKFVVTLKGHGYLNHILIYIYKSPIHKMHILSLQEIIARSPPA